ncbi:MAG: RICIN domain-containing protein [Clostridia bacterium]|nr:RICIN domain-containing protein [Clostridia bacterium]
MTKFKQLLSLVLAICILSGMNMLHLNSSASYAETLPGRTDNSVSENFEIPKTTKDSELQTKELVSELKEDSLIMDYIDESTFVESKHVARLKDKEKLNTYVFLNNDGSESVYIMEKNVKYISDDGKTHEKNISLIHEDESYNVKDNDVNVSIPENPTDGIELGYKGSNVKLIPQNGSADATAALNSADNSITYENYFGTGTDLRYTPLLSGIKEDIILSSYTGVSSFEFILYTNGLKIFSEEGSYYLAANEGVNDKIYLGDIIVYDAVGRPDNGTLKIETVSEGSEYILTVSADEDFLTDPMTMYPVVIDPTLEICDNVQGLNSITDATVFKGFPDENFGDYQYCTLGQINSGYGIARTIIRFDGLASSGIYKSLAASDITSAKFYVREATGVSAINVSVHYNQSTAAWTETGVTWNTATSQISDAIATANLSNNEWTPFELTDYVKRCRTGELTLDSGLVMKLTGSETSTYTQFNSSEQATAGFRPYLVLTYSGDTTITLNKTSVDIDEFNNMTLVATTNPANLDVDWSSSNTSVATISSKGVLRARKAGVTRITAEIEGTNVRAYCSVYVTVSDGIYVIKNMSNGMVLDAANNGIANNTNVLLCSKNSYCGGLNQCWRVKHLGSGYYSVRPLHKLDMCLYTDGSNVTVYSSSLNEHIDTTPTSKRWTITYEIIEGTSEKGYVFKTSGGSKALTYADISNSNNDDAIVSPRVLSDKKQYWTLSKDASLPASGVRVYDVHNPGVFYDSNYHPGEMFTREMWVNSSNSLLGLGLKTAYYSSDITDSIYQDFEFSSSNSGVVSVDEQSGRMTSHKVGTATITGCNNVNNDLSYFRIKIVVVAVKEGTYYIKNFGTSHYLQLDDDRSSNYSESGIIMEQHEFDGKEYQQWIITSLENGYHKIESVESGLVLSVRSGETSTANVNIVQEAYTGALRQQWVITEADSGALIIKARSSEGNSVNLVMALGAGSNSADGVNIQQRKYGSVNKYTDEWCIRTVEYAYSIGGEINDGDNAIEAADNWRLCGYTSYYDITPTVEDLCQDFLNSEIVYFSSHGEQHGLDLPNNVALSDGKHLNNPNYAFIDEYSLPNAKLFVYAACSTASLEDGSGYNLCTKTIDAGVDCVVGWPVDIYVDDQTDWFKHFQSALIAGGSVKDARDYANGFKYYDNESIKSCIIFGNQNLVVNKDLSIDAISAYENINEPLIYTNIACESYEENAIKAILDSNFDTFSNDEAIVTVTPTNIAKTSCVIDYIYLHNGFNTKSGYSLIVEDGMIVAIRDNTIKAEICESMNIPEVTQEIISKAKKQAVSEVCAIDENYRIVEQQGEKYFDVETAKYYYKVMTAYETPNNAHGGITTMYELI